jgi:ABC-2 type transport system permease protein
MNIWRIAINDMRVILKDRMVLVWWVAMPLAFVFMFGIIIPDQSEDATWLPVFKLDDHELTSLFVDQLRAEGYFVDEKPTEDQQWIKDWPRALVIPRTFSEDILQGRRVDLTLTKGKGRPERILAVQTLLVRTLIKFNGAVAAVDLIERGWSAETRNDLTAELAKPPQLSVENGQDFSLQPPPSGFAFTLPAYLVMFLMMNTIMYGGITLIYERSEKRMSRLMAAPVSVVDVFLGKMLGRMLQPIVQGVLLIAAGVTLFGIHLGDHPLVLVPVILSFSFFCGAIGLLFGVCFKSEQQVMGLGILSTMLLAALGGCWWPLEVTPQTFQTIALFTPTYWAIQGIHDVMSFGKSWSAVLPECGILTAFGLVITAIAIPLFHRAS